jgi:membrane protease YdiL (CAAX protease family)
MIEGFAIYLGGFVFIGRVVQEVLPGVARWGSMTAALGFVILGVFWPRMRGMPAGVWRQCLGLHKGEGFLTEVRHGLQGWVTGLPLLIACVMITSIIVKLTGLNPSHPILEEAGGPDAWWSIPLLAVVWAPITEELTFRGLLFPGLSAFCRARVAALVSAFVFAIIHPQGIAGVPPIMAIALTMATLRVQRGSILAPMAAHALNNGIITALLLAMG